MTIVSTMGGTMVQDYWKGFMPGNNAQHPIAWHRRRGTWVSTSFKDLNAQAHCAAAYLMAKGLRKGDHVAILSRQTPEYLVLDIALQFLGVVNMTLPMDISQKEMEALIREYQFPFVYYADPAAFHGHQQLMKFKPDLRGIIIASDEVDDLDPDKIVTMDRVVNLGKAEWREQTAQLNAMKAQVQPQDVYTILYPDAARAESQQTVRYRDLLAATAAAEQHYQEAETKLVLSLLDPIRLRQRSHGVFAALRLQVPFYLLPAADLTQPLLAELRPQAIVTDPAGLEELYTELPTFLGDAVAITKAMDKAKAVVAKREEAISQGKKNPFFNRMRYRFGNQKLYSRVHAKLGGKVQFFVVDNGELTSETKLFFEECSLKLVR